MILFFTKKSFIFIQKKYINVIFVHFSRNVSINFTIQSYENSYKSMEKLAQTHILN